MYKPAWFDGDVDSLGECGVGTQQRFRSPVNGNGIFWYAFSSGSVTIITLSSEHDYTEGSPQGLFLQRQLAAVNRSLTPWIVVTQHRHLYHLSGSEMEMQLNYLATLEPLFKRYKVDLVLTGHVHNSLRTCSVFNWTCTPGAPVYIVSGSSGALLEDYSLNDPNGLVQWYNTFNKFVPYLLSPTPAPALFPFASVPAVLTPHKRNPSSFPSDSLSSPSSKTRTWCCAQWIQCDPRCELHPYAHTLVQKL